MKLSVVFAGALACTLLSGCMTEEPIQAKFKDPRITLSGTDAFGIELVRSNVYVNENGLLTANACAYINRSSGFRWTFKGDTKLVVFYQYEWFDAAGKTYTESSRFDAMPGNLVNFHGIAPEEKYVGFRLKISMADAADIKKKEDAQKKAAAKADKSKAKAAAPAPTVKTAEPKAAATVPVKRIGKNMPDEPPTNNGTGSTVPAAPKAKAAAPKAAAPAPAVKTAAPKEKLTEPFN